MAEHRLLGARQAHTVFRRVFASEAAIAADSTKYRPAEIGILALVSNNTVWRLSAIGPTTWSRVTAPVLPRLTTSVIWESAGVGQTLQIGIPDYLHSAEPTQEIGTPGWFTLAAPNYDIGTLDGGVDGEQLGTLHVAFQAAFTNLGSAADFSLMFNLGIALGTVDEILIRAISLAQTTTPQSSVVLFALPGYSDTITKEALEAVGGPGAQAQFGLQVTASGSGSTRDIRFDFATLGIVQITQPSLL